MSSLVGKSLKNISGDEIVSSVVDDVLSSGVPNLVVDNFTFSTTPNLDNTENRLLVLNTGDDEIEYREVSSLPVVNPFNQDLNTTDDVEFNTLKLTTPTLDNTENRLLVLNTSDNEIEFRDVSSLPVVNPFDQDLNTTDDVEFNTMTAFSAELNRLTGTGNLIVERNIVLPSTELNGASKLQTQQLFVSSTAQINGNISSSTGEVRLIDNLNMNANDIINVGTLNFDSIVNNNSNTNILTFDGSNNVEYREVSSLPVVNPFDQDLNTTDDVEFNTLKLTTPTLDNTENRLLVLNTSDNEVEYREVSSLPVVNPFDQDLNTTDNVEFNNLNTNSTFTNVLTTNGAGFITLPNSLSVVGSGENITLTSGNDLILSNRVLDNTADKILVQDGSNITKYREVSSLPVVNPFNQDLNITDNVQFNAVNTSQILSNFGDINVFDNFNMTNREITNINEIEYNDYNSKQFTKIITNREVQGNAETTLVDWTNSSGTLGGFNNLTGTFTPVRNGIYAFCLFAGILTPDSTSEMTCKIFNTFGGATRYISTLLSSDLSSPFEGAVTFCSTNIFFSGESLNLSIQCNSTETWTFILRVIRIG